MKIIPFYKNYMLNMEMIQYDNWMKLGAARRELTCPERKKLFYLSYYWYTVDSPYLGHNENP